MKNFRKAMGLVWAALVSTVALAQPHAPVSAPTASSDVLQAEASQFRRTGTYAEVEALCQSWAQRYPEVVRCLNMGQTAEGRIMRAMVVTRTGALTPEQADRANIPVE